jgi:hypothetical protein
MSLGKGLWRIVSPLLQPLFAGFLRQGKILFKTGQASIENDSVPREGENRCRT